MEEFRLAGYGHHSVRRSCGFIIRSQEMFDLFRLGGFAIPHPHEHQKVERISIPPKRSVEVVNG